MKNRTGLVLLTVTAVFLSGCAFWNPGPGYSHVICEKTAYYKDSPAQGRPADGTFTPGTYVNIVREAGSYTLVTAENGITVYVSTSALAEM